MKYKYKPGDTAAVLLDSVDQGQDEWDNVDEVSVVWDNVDEVSVVHTANKKLDPTGEGLLWVVGKYKNFQAGQILMLKLLQIRGDPVCDSLWEVVTDAE